MTQKRVVERTVVDPSPEPQSEIGRPPQNAIDASAKSNAPDRAEKYVPSGRPLVPTLCMLDNASDTNGEFFRLRDKITILGRVEGNVLVSHDPDVSAKHARIERHAALGCYSWKLVDEASTNGTYVRRSGPIKGDGGCFLVGRLRLGVSDGLGDDQSDGVSTMCQSAQQSLQSTRSIQKDSHEGNNAASPPVPFPKPDH